MDRGAWWAAVYGVAQSWTWLKQLSSSSSSDSSHSLLVHICEMRIFSSNFALFLGMCRGIVNSSIQKITPSVFSLVPKLWSCIPGISKEKQLPVTIWLLLWGSRVSFPGGENGPRIRGHRLGLSTKEAEKWPLVLFLSSPWYWNLQRFMCPVFATLLRQQKDKRFTFLFLETSRS